MKYKVTNLTEDIRKFRDSMLGEDVLVEPMQTIITESPPEESDVWKVEINTEKTEEKKNLKGGKQEMKTKKHRMLDKE